MARKPAVLGVTVIGFVALILALSGAVGPDDASAMEPTARGHTAAQQGPAAVQAPVEDSLATSGRADVLVLLDDGMSAAGSAELSTDGLAAAVEDVRESVLAELPAGSFRQNVRYELLPILAGSVDERGLQALRRDGRVLAIEEDTWVRPIALERPATTTGRTLNLEEAVPVIGADYVQNVLGITGEGITVAVLDTGIDNEHPDFEGKILDQYCYSSSRSCAPNNIVEGPNAQDEYGHGTAVSGIILSKGVEAHVGVAPGADLAAVRVFKDKGGAANSDIIKGLDWVLRKQHPLNIRVVNMSLGGGSSIGNNCDDQNRAMKAAFQRLVARQIAIFVATGNNGYPSQVSSPACISNSIAVGATYDVEAPNGGGWCPRQKDVTPLTIACFTNRGRAMDLLAPGIFIRSSKLGGGVTKNGAGTSYAAPMAAGVAALMLQVNPDMRPSEIERVMQRTGTEVKHLENNDIFKLVNARRAVEAVMPPTPTPSVTPVPSSTPTQQATEVPPTATDGPRATDTPQPSQTPTVTPEATESNTTLTIFLPSLRNREP